MLYFKRTICLFCQSKFLSSRAFQTEYFYGLNEEQIKLKDSVKKFCSIKLAPFASIIDKNNGWENLRTFWKELGTMGLHGITVPIEYGGLQLGYLDHLLVMEEISHSSGAIGLSYGAHSNLCINQISRNASDFQKKKYLEKLISGEHIGSLAMSESSCGSDVLSMKLAATPYKDHFVLNGYKSWITNAPDADIFIVYAKTPSNSKRPQDSITAFLIERNFKGFSVSPKLDKLGMRGSNTAEIVFNDCIVPNANVLGDINCGTKVLMSGLDLERLVLSGGPLGIMQAAIDVSFDYVHQRSGFGQKVAQFQIMQSKLADMYLDLSTSRSYVYNVAKSIDNGTISTKDCAGSILYSSERAVHVCLQAIQCLGGNGYTNDYPTGRFLRDAKLYEIGAGTNEIRRWLIGRLINKSYSL